MWKYIFKKKDFMIFSSTTDIELANGYKEANTLKNCGIYSLKLYYLLNKNSSE